MNPETRANYLEHVHGLIAKHHWFCQAVGGDALNPSWAYTVGFHLIDSPEVAITGLHPKQAHHLLANLYVRALTAPLVPGLREGILEGYAGWLRPCRTDDTDFPLAVAVEYFEKVQTPGMTALQFCWPDRQGRFPTQDDFDLGFDQPLLKEPIP